jgi:sporulation protein YlmC with PRC-barrel domain
MKEFTEAYDFEGRTLIDRDGEKLGKVEELYVDDRGEQPEWALVHSGLFGMKKTFVPLQGAQPVGEDVRVPIEKAQVKDAPHIDPDGRLSEQEEQRLFEHYGVPYTTEGTTTATGAPGSSAQAQPRVGTEQAERGRGRLRK